jgi:outer membrane receptor protein involved in Fe transport
MLKNVIYMAMLLVSTSLMGQGTITGKVIDPESGEGLPGANIQETGTDNGTITDFEGYFELEVSSDSGAIKITYLGYQTRSIPFNLVDGKLDLGNIDLKVQAGELGEVVVTGVVDIAKSRETPVAVSTIRAEEIQQKLGSQEFPEILNTTPSIYATKQGGGFGDSRVTIRGFDTRNSAVMINGIPINDMENGIVYWSNWAGLSDVAAAIQVQRGLGSSKLAVSSVGGTINIVTRSSLKEEGGFVSGSVGNDGYLKTVASYSTGMLESGLSLSALFSRTAGDGYVDGTKFEGYNYFLAIGYEFNPKNSLEFTVTGAPQWHHQRSRGISIENYLEYGDGSDPNIKYNDEWGYKNGEEYSFRRNFYHKPVLSLNLESELSENMTLSNSLYASFGRGGGTGEIGEINGARQFALPRTANGLVRVDDIVTYNSGGYVPAFDFTEDGVQDVRQPINGLYINAGNNNPNGEDTNGITRRASVNSHNWYGLISNLGIELSETWALDVGVDLRTYKGFHYRRVNDLLGADAYQQTDNMQNADNPIFTETYTADQPWWVFGNIEDEEKIDYYNIGYVNWAGVFGQLEYSDDVISAFVQGSLSNQGFAREEFFNDLEGRPQKTDYENILGGNIKAGINYNIDENHNVFANAGYYSKQPLFDAVFINFSNTVNPNLQNEKVIGTEVGYGYRNNNLVLNLDLYRTSWSDRFESVSETFEFTDPTDPTNTAEVRGVANLEGIKQVHMGVEFEGSYRMNDVFELHGMLSIGNWEYQGDVRADYFTDSQDPVVNPFTGEQVAPAVLELDGVKVGDVAQFTASIGAEVTIVEDLSVDSDFRYADNLYADFEATDITTGSKGVVELPGYGLLDAGASYSLDADFLGEGNSIDFRVNVNNLLDTIYISESDTNNFAEAGDPTYDGIATSNRVFFGFGRTWNASVRINF